MRPFGSNSFRSNDTWMLNAWRRQDLHYGLVRRSSITNRCPVRCVIPDCDWVADQSVTSGSVTATDCLVLLADASRNSQWKPFRGVNFGELEYSSTTTVLLPKAAKDTTAAVNEIARVTLRSKQNWSWPPLLPRRRPINAHTSEASQAQIHHARQDIDRSFQLSAARCIPSRSIKLLQCDRRRVVRRVGSEKQKPHTTSDRSVWQW
jgi:hypothetical protein